MSLSSKVRDPIHGFIEWKPKELELIDTPVFQRLRGIRQLAMAYLVYPGALHSRFEHSLGTFHIASRIAAKVGLAEDENNLVRFAAILHDIGHGPFSHVSEAPLRRLCDPLKLPSGNREKIHEKLTCDIIRYNSNIVRCLGAGLCSEIVELLTKGFGRQIVKNIVSGPLDADKMDYLLRDSLYCGVQYGIYDLNQLITSFKEVKGDQDDATLGIERDGIYSLEQFLLAKHYLATQVYHHRIRLITDAMLSRALILGAERDGIEELKRLFGYDGSEGFIDNFVCWDDEGLFSLILSRYRGSIAADLFNRLRQRRLFKRIYKMRLGDEKDSEKRQKLSELYSCSTVIEKIEAEVAVALKLKPYEVILQTPDRPEEPESGSESEGQIIVEDGSLRTTFEEESKIYSKVSQSLDEPTIECFAGVEYRNPVEMRRLLEECTEIVNKSIQHHLEVEVAN